MAIAIRNIALGAIAALSTAAIATGLVSPAVAGDKGKTVVELYTSQGCSSCPPADHYLGELTKRDDVVALTFPVDYWDYLGWKDTLARPEYSARQRAYARSRRDGQVYTPQMVIDGKFHAVGSRKYSVKQTILKARAARTQSVPLDIKTEGNSMVITVGDAYEGMRVRPATVWLVHVKESETVKIDRGENRGETITYYNVVRDMSPVGQWNGKKVTIKLPLKPLKKRGGNRCAVILQQDNEGPVLAGVQMSQW